MPSNTKEKIINTAQKLFAEKGFHGTSMREISREAGVSLSMINYHYGSKEALFKSFVQNLFNQLFEGVKEIQSKDISAKEKLSAFIDLFANLIQKNEDLSMFLDKEVFTGESPELALWLLSRMNQINEMVEEIIKEGVENENFQLKVELTFLVSVPASLFTFWLKGGGVAKMFDGKAEAYPRLSIEEFKENVKQTIFSLL